MQINADRHGSREQPSVLENLHWLCTPDVALRGGLFLGLFVAGAAGSVIHCAPMCGAFVLGQVSDRMARLGQAQLCERQRISTGMLVPYHLGRLMTYAVIGAAAAESAAVLQGKAWFGALSAALLVLAAGLFFAQAIRRMAPSSLQFVSMLERSPAGWGRLVGRVTRGIPRGSAPGEFAFGLALGFLPCGFLYAAIAAAAATARPDLAAGAMVAFGLGTVPSLMVIGIMGQAAGRRWHRGVVATAPVLMALNAVLLLLLAWQRVT